MTNPLPSSWIAMNSWELRKSIHSTVTLNARLFDIRYAKPYNTLFDISLFCVYQCHERHLCTRLVRTPRAWMQPTLLGCLVETSSCPFRDLRLCLNNRLKKD